MLWYVLIYLCTFHHVKPVRIRSLNQPVLSDEGKISCSRKQQKRLIGLVLPTDLLQVRRATHCATPPLKQPRCEVFQQGLLHMQCSYLFIHGARRFGNSFNHNQQTRLCVIFCMEENIVIKSLYNRKGKHLCKPWHNRS